MNPKLIIAAGFAVCFLGVVFNILFGFPLVLPAAALGFIILVLGLFDYPLTALLVILGLRVLLDKFSEYGISLGGMSLNLSATLALMVIAGAVLFVVFKQTLPRTDAALVLFAAFVVFGFATIPWAVNAVNAFADAIRFLSYAGILALAGTTIHNREQYQKFIALFPFILLIPIAVAVFETLTGGGRLDFSTMKPIGTFFHPNYLGYASLIGVSAIIMLWFEFPILQNQRLKQIINSFKTFYLAFAAVLAYFVFASGSLGARIALLLAAATLLLLKWKRWLVFIPIAAFCASLLFPWYNFELQQRGYPILENQTFRAIIGESEEDGSFAWRVRNWQSMFGFIEGKTLFGWGLGSYKPLREIRFEYLTDLAAPEAHNDYMNFMVEAGAVGLSLFVLFFLWTLVLLYQGKSPSSIVLFSLLTATMTAMGVENIFKGASIVWPLFALIGATLSQKLEDHEITK